MFNFKSIVGSFVGGFSNKEIPTWEKEGYSCEEEWLYSEQWGDNQEGEESWEVQEINAEWYEVGTRFWDYFHDQQRYEIQCIPDLWEYDNMVGVGNPFDVEDLNF